MTSIKPLPLKKSLMVKTLSRDTMSELVQNLKLKISAQPAILCANSNNTIVMILKNVKILI